LEEAPFAMQRQALDLVIGSVASIEDVDRAWIGIFKMPIGPFGMMDQIGLDTIQGITAHWAKVLNDPDGEKRAAFLEEFTSQGYCGTKTSGVPTDGLAKKVDSRWIQCEHVVTGTQSNANYRYANTTRTIGRIEDDKVALECNRMKVGEDFVVRGKASN
jgi:3-hydroxyacyl-CoA dehydrogenase